MTVAALYVQPGGVYCGLPDVEPWGLPERDAREYAGPWPVVAHPPCQRWGRYWYGGPMLHKRGHRLKLGDDGGCFAAALSSVRAFGGVIEHPAASKAWHVFGLNTPSCDGGWVNADLVGGWTCHVEQCHYGPRARKATWLYAFGCELPSLQWGPGEGSCRLDEGFHSSAERQAAKDANGGRLPDRCRPERLSKRERSATPLPFRDLLLSIARSALPSRPLPPLPADRGNGTLSA
jgi:hypothetical protein